MKKIILKVIILEIKQRVIDLTNQDAFNYFKNAHDCILVPMYKNGGTISIDDLQIKLLRKGIPLQEGFAKIHFLEDLGFIRINEGFLYFNNNEKEKILLRLRRSNNE